MRVASDNSPDRRQQISNFVNVPAPVGGINTLDAVASMPATDALVLDNWFCRPGYVEIRGGSASHATGMTGTGKTLAVYNSLSGTNKMFCATNSGVYNVSSAGVVGASVASVTNGKFQHLMFGDGTSNWLIMLNGVDKPLYYDGTTWTAVDNLSTPALTGITTTNLIGSAIHKGRLMFIAKNSLAFWYLASGAAGGALSSFDLSMVAKKGGYLVAADSWTVDGGNGPDDRMVFITSEGECIIYTGTNPAAAATWSLVGVYNIGRPLGRKCLVKVNSDLVLLTNTGAFALSSVLTGEADTDANNALTRKIGRLYNESAQSYGSIYGWKTTLLPLQSAAIVNVPLAEDGMHYQYVMNTITKSWCRFIGWDAEDFAVFNDELYYCQGTAVIHAWTGQSDQGANIDAYGKTAFNFFGKRGQLKKFNLMRPSLAVNGDLSFLVDLDVDFSDADIVGNATYTVNPVAKWGVSYWGQAYWSTGLQIIKNWSSPSAWPGYCAAGKIKISTNSLTVQWLSNDYVYEVGNGL